MDVLVDDLTSQSLAFQLKGSLFTLPTLHLLTTELAIIRSQLITQIQRSPVFFKNAPIIIELQKIADDSKVLDFNAISSLLRDFELIPVGVRGGTEQQNKMAVTAGLAVLTNIKSIAKESVAIKKQSTLQSKTKLISQPVRSGQQIYAKSADLIVMAPVSAGAELLADGHIHVYGPLRGRALAGVNGDKTARIFCKNLAAELVSIAGHYWVSEDLKVPFDREGVQVYLEADKLRLGLL